MDAASDSSVVFPSAVSSVVSFSVDAAVSVERQTYTFKKVLTVLASDFELSDKDDARGFFNQLRQKFLDWNYIPWNTDEFKAKEKEILDLYASKKGTIQASAMDLFKDGE